MLASSKIHHDRALAGQAAASGKSVGRQNSRLKQRQKEWAGGRDGNKASSQTLEAFRAHAQAAAASAQFLPSVDMMSDTRRRRSSVVAIVKKRVEMLQMNAVSREFTQVLVSAFLVVVLSGYGCDNVW